MAGTSTTCTPKKPVVSALSSWRESADSVTITTIADPGGAKPGLNQGVFDSMRAFADWCNGQGGILDDVLVYRLQDFWLMVVNASNREKIVRWIEQHKPGRNVTVTDRTRQWAMVALQGPRAIEPP